MSDLNKKLFNAFWILVGGVAATALLIVLFMFIMWITYY